MSNKKFLLTGAMGCIGSWVLKELVNKGEKVVAADYATDMVRPKLLMGPEEIKKIKFIRADITDLDGICKICEENHITNIIHLAALQVPSCKANPPVGARINVEGTVNIFESARRYKSFIQGVVFASSVAVFGRDENGEDKIVLDKAQQNPSTLYGAYKQANETIAKIYWQDWQVSSIGIRPYIAYGVGRDQGLTSDLTKALLAAACYKKFKIGFDGMVALQYTRDIARIIIECSKTSFQGAIVCNLRNNVISVEDFVSAIKTEVPAAQITYEKGNFLPFPAELDDSSLRSLIKSVPNTALHTGIKETIESFRQLISLKKINIDQIS